MLCDQHTCHFFTFGGDTKEVLDILCSIISVANKANVGWMYPRIFLQDWLSVGEAVCLTRLDLVSSVKTSERSFWKFGPYVGHVF